MSKKLKENQIIAAKLISFGFSSRSVSKWINVREETISRWKAQKVFVEEIQNQQSDILDFIKEKHFQLFMKSLSIIQKALENDDISLKDKAMISTRYLSLSSGYIMKNINKSSYQKTLNIVSFPLQGCLGINSAKAKEPKAKIPAVQNTKNGEANHKKPRTIGKKIAAM